jgi:hypothetical protein
MTRLLLALGILSAVTSESVAQNRPDDISITEFDPGFATRPTSSIEGPGIKIGERTTLHPVFGIESGVVSNVFYEEENTRTAGILRLLAQIGTASLSTKRLSPSYDSIEDDEASVQEYGSFQYRANVRLAYDLMLSGNEVVSDTGGLGVGALFKGMINPLGPWSFGFDENFTRMIRAANFETEANTNRDINLLRLLLLYHPSGRSLSGYLYYNNTIDIFEKDTQNFANRWQHRFGIHPMWRWLPQTMFFADISWGVSSGLGEEAEAQKVTSYPLRATVGVSTLLSLKTTLNIQAGYTNGFYASGPNFSAPVASAQLGYRYSPLGRLVLGYEYMHVDSINANFYRDHVATFRIAQGFSPVVLMVQPELHFRTYRGISLVEGPSERDDIIFAVVGGMHYNFRDWAMATINYRFATVVTDYMYTVDGSTFDDPGYVRHELLAGFRVAM